MSASAFLLSDATLQAFNLLHHKVLNSKVTYFDDNLNESHIFSDCMEQHNTGTPYAATLRLHYPTAAMQSQYQLAGALHILTLMNFEFFSAPKF